jgi:hypothetical protein
MFARILSLLAFCASVGATVSDCSKGESLFTLTSMSLTPDPPVRGQNSTLRLSMNVPEQVTNGTATYTVTYNFLPLRPTVDDLCDTTVPCPIAPGNLDTVSSYPFDNALSGSLVVRINWNDLTGRSLLCVSMNLKLGNAAKQVAKYAWPRLNRTFHH